MSAETIRRAIFSALAASPLIYAGCKDPETPIPVPPPTEMPRDTPTVDASTPPSPSAPQAPPASATASLPPPPRSSEPPTPTPTTVASAPSPVAPEPPVPKPSWCKATRAYCIPAHKPPPSFGNVPPPPPGSPDPTHYDRYGCVARSEMPTSCSGMTFLKGPSARKGECCYDVCQGPVPPCGRPFVVDGIARVPSFVARDDWSASGEAVALPHDPDVRAQLRDAWLADAAMEHASVASFARLALELLSVGAPPDLVRGAHEAALDEIEHARLAFGLANALDPAQNVGPAPFREAAKADLATSVEELVAATVRDGCVGETFAALVAAEAARVCTEPRSRAVLLRIADDERAHAAYAFRVVAWAIRFAGEPARTRAERAFAEANVSFETDIGAGALSTTDLAPYGRLGSEALAELRVVAFRDILAPTMATLVGTNASPALEARADAHFA